MNRFILIFLLSGLFTPSFSGEGMWIPLLLDSLNYRDMQEKGLRLSPEQIFSNNQASLKDAVVIFGNGCTGEVISPEGLVITNHHCGYSRIQAHSTVEKNYLTDGFWAKSQQEELANPGLTVSFLVRIENVTDRVLKGITGNMRETERLQQTALNIASIRSDAILNTNYQAEIKPFFFGNEYYLFVYEVFRDVRLVGNPPEAIGNFGGDTDNWIWPRHTGDFSLFRIYADKDNKPADYSPDNVPYKPKKHLNISVNGVSEGDFTMILGYPGRTDQYLISDALELIAGYTLPAKVEMRTARLEAIQSVMDRGPEYKLRYASKHKTIANSWKKWMGVTSGVKRADVIAGKRKLEEDFVQWASDKPEYHTLMNDFRRLFDDYSPLYKKNDIGSELLNSIELTALTDRTQIRFFSMGDSSEAGKRVVIEELKRYAGRFFKTNALEIDRKVLPQLLRIYASYTHADERPEFFKQIGSDYNDNYEAYVSDILEKSMFADSVKYRKVLDKPEKAIRNTIINDPLITIYRDFAVILAENGAHDRLDSLESEMVSFYRKYINGLMAMDTNRTFYPDANFTMRLTYGKIEGYEPMDAINYNFYSTLDGIMEKENPEIADYNVPAKLKELYSSSDFGSHLQNGNVPVCFIASNHTSGGNSGSPVIDADGNLIGINFDRNWEGTVSDFAYDPKVCRNISLDVRYVIYIIDKLADADWILNELTLIKN